MVTASHLVEIISQSKLLEIARSCRRGSDGLPKLVLAAPQVMGAQAREQVVVPEHVGLQRGAPVHDGAHCCHLQARNSTRNHESTSLNVTFDL